MNATLLDQLQRTKRHYFKCLALTVLVLCAIPWSQVFADEPSPSGTASEPKPKPKQVPALIIDLKSPDVAVRRKAAEALDNLGEQAKAAAPALLEALSDPDVEVRRTAAFALGSCDAERQAARPPLIKVLQNDTDGDVRGNALFSLDLLDLGVEDRPLLLAVENDADPKVRRTLMEALADYSHHNRDTLLLVVRGLEDEDRHVRSVALSATRRLRAALAPVRPELRARASDLKRQVRAPFILALAASGPEPGDVKLVLAACEDNVEEVRHRAMEGLTMCEPFSEDMVRVALAGLKDKNYCVRSTAVQALAAMGSLTPEVVPALVGLMKRDELFLQQECADALGTMGPAAVLAIEDLIALSRQRSLLRSGRAAQALARIGPQNDQVLPAILQALEELRDPRDVILTIKNLRAWGPKAAPAVPKLILLLRTDPDKSISKARAVTELLGHIGPPAAPAVPALLEAVRNTRDAGLKVDFANTVGKIGPSAKDAVPLLTEFVSDEGKENDYLFICAAMALGRIGADARDAEPLLRKLFADRKKYESETNSRWHFAAIALAGIGAADEVVPLFIQEMDNPQATLSQRAAAVYVLGRIGSPALAGRPSLWKYFSDRKHPLYWTSALALARLGESDRVVEVMVEHLKSLDDSRVINAIDVLADIGPPAKAAVKQLEKYRRRYNPYSFHADDIDAAIEAIAGTTAIRWPVCETNDF